MSNIRLGNKLTGYIFLQFLFIFLRYTSQKRMAVKIMLEKKISVFCVDLI